MSGGQARGDVPNFSREILPVLSENCFHCHGQDAKARKGDLRLDVEADARRPIDGRFPVLAGKSTESEIIRRMLSTDPDEVMPPPKSNRKVTQEQIGMIGRWIDGGAKWGKHWAFTRIEKPEVPGGVKHGGNPIDAFVRAKLAEKGMKPSPRADAETLIRRVTLDLTGLPPTLEETAAFVSENVLTN